jgi:hypothetical protein
MFEETLYQKSREGVQFVDLLKQQGILPGIKVDTGLQVLPGTDGETTTQGLDNLGAVSWPTLLHGLCVWHCGRAAFTRAMPNSCMAESAGGCYVRPRLLGHATAGPRQRLVVNTGGGQGSCTGSRTLPFRADAAL